MADLPGFESEDIRVTFDDGVLSISAHQEAAEDDEKTVHRHARSVRESLRIPGDVDADAISGTYRNGVLEVTLPTLEAPEDDTHVIDLE
jgi:HSP20 family protein